MKRGDLYWCAINRDFGKIRPALIIQNGLLLEGAPTVVVLPLTGASGDPDTPRVQVSPSARNGLEKPSDIMIDKPHAIRIERIKDRIGEIDAGTLRLVESRLRFWLDL